MPRTQINYTDKRLAEVYPDASKVAIMCDDYAFLSVRNAYKFEICSPDQSFFLGIKDVEIAVAKKANDTRTDVFFGEEGELQEPHLATSEAMTTSLRRNRDA